jgi:hypothetical protein
MPVILAIWEAENRRLAVPSQHCSSGDPVSKIPNKKHGWHSG